MGQPTMGILLWDALLWDTLLWENLLWENQLWDNLPARQSSTVYPPRVTSSRMSPIGKIFSVRSPMGRQSSCRIVSCRTTFYTLALQVLLGNLFHRSGPVQNHCLDL